MGLYFYDEKQINKIFKTKYPNGKIKIKYRDAKNDLTLFEVKFNNHSRKKKIWEKSALELLKSFNFNVVSETFACATVMTIANLENEIKANENGGREEEFTIEELKEIIADIKDMRAKLKNSFIIRLDLDAPHYEDYLKYYEIEI